MWATATTTTIKQITKTEEKQREERITGLFLQLKITFRFHCPSLEVSFLMNRIDTSKINGKQIHRSRPNAS